MPVSGPLNPSRHGLLSRQDHGEKVQIYTKSPPISKKSAGFLVRPEGFEPPAFWSVGCLTRKSEPFWLRFVLFATIRSADFPLFPSRPVCFFRILGQKWVKEDFVIISWNGQAFGLKYFQVTNAETHDRKRSFEKLRRFQRRSFSCICVQSKGGYRGLLNCPPCSPAGRSRSNFPPQAQRM